MLVSRKYGTSGSHACAEGTTIAACGTLRGFLSVHLQLLPAPRLRLFLKTFQNRNINQLKISFTLIFTCMTDKGRNEGEETV